MANGCFPYLLTCCYLGPFQVAGALIRVVIREFVESVVKPAVRVLVELFGVPGARTTPRLAKWCNDTPEQKLNLWLLAEAFLQVIASGLGTLALVWATVVLLGGFSTMLVSTDFWFITAIVFVETARIVGYNSAREAKFLADLPAALYQDKISRAETATNFIRLVILGPTTWIALTPVLVATACMSLSIIRLVGLARLDYGSGSETSSNDNMKPALILFYGLVLTQGALLLIWFIVAVMRSHLAANLNRRYLGSDTHLHWTSKKALIDRYVCSIVDTCIEKGVVATINTNFVSFAAELLLQSQHPNDHIDAVVVLHSLAIRSPDRSDGAVEQICCSGELVYRLVQLLCSESRDHNGIKVNIAEIVAKVACKLRLADIPGAAHCISSLLDSRFIMMKNAVQTGHDPQPQGVNHRTVDINSRGEIKPLFVHGLVILSELAVDPVNCTEICNTMDLVPKIIAPVSSGLHMVMKNDETTVEIVRESLCVLAKLTRATGNKSSRELCQELTTTTNYGSTVDNILWILSNSSDQAMRMLAVEILSRLNLAEPIKSNFTAELQRLLLDPPDSPLRIEAGKALIARGDESADIQQLVTVMTNAQSKEYRAVIAEMLAQICARSQPGQDRIIRLSPVSNALFMVLKAIVIETTDITELDIKFLASFLGLAEQICEKLATAESFANAVTGLTEPPMANNIIFAETLKRIIEATNNSDDEVCLAIMKSATNLIKCMTEIDNISIGYYIDYFREANIVQKLDAAVKAMAHLERYMIMTGGAEKNKEYVTLQTLVQREKKKLVPRRRRPQPPPPPQQQQPPQQPQPTPTPLPPPPPPPQQQQQQPSQQLQPPPPSQQQQPQPPPPQQQ